LKTDFTRTGRRTLNGLLADGINSTKRYFLNNFDDGRKQVIIRVGGGGGDDAQMVT
jgi:hypothetical protein